MSREAAETIEDLLAALAEFSPGHEAADDLLSYFYEGNAEILSKLDDIRALGSARDTNIERGRLMEQVAYLALRGIFGVGELRSFRSAGPQYDLLVEMDLVKSQVVKNHLFLPNGRQDILVECKAIKCRIDDSMVARLCSILDHHLTKAGLGIFFSLHGATGDSSRASIQGARLRQLLFFVRTSIPIIVLNSEEISTLGENGSLLKLVAAKVRALSALRGDLPPPISGFQACDSLPDHLAAL